MEFVKKLFNLQGTKEKDDTKNILEFKRICEHPSGSDLVYYPNDNREDSPKGVIKQAKQWRATSGKPGFKTA